MSKPEVSIKLSVSGDAQVKSALIDVEQKLDRLSGAISRAGHYGLGFLGLTQGIGPAARAMLGAADAVTTLNNQLRLATGSTQAATQAYNALFDIAQRSRVSFTELGSTFASISRAGQALGLSQERLLGVTEALGNALTISGGSADGMKAALVQLGQGLASGTLRGEELNSVMEQTPRLAKALADGLGVSIGKLREMGAAGQLTGEQVIKALESQSQVLSGEVQGAVLTVGQAFTQLQNASIKAAGDMDRATGATSALASGLQGLSGVVQTVGEAFKNNEAAIQTTLGLLAGATVAAGLARTATALGTVAGGVGAVSTSVTVLKGVVASLNPATLALLGLGAAVGYANSQAGNLDNLKAKLQELQAYGNAAGEFGQATPETKAQTAARLAEIERLKAAIKAYGEEAAQANFLAIGGNAERALREANAKAAASYDDLRVRLSGFKGDYEKYAADLVRIQAGMASGDISQKQGIAWLTELALKHGEVGKAVGSRAAKEVEATESAKLYASAMQELVGSSIEAEAAAAGYTKTQKELLEIFTSPGFADMPDTWKQSIVAQAEGVIAAERLAEANKGLGKAMKEARKAAAEYGKQLDAIALAGADLIEQANDRTQAVEDQVAATEFELSLMGKSNTERAIALKQYQIERDLKRDISKINETIASQEDKDYAIDAAKRAANRAKANAAAEVVNTEFQRVSQQIEQSLTDALMRGFESGKDFAANLRDTVVNMFNTMVLRPIINPVAGAITGSLGLAGAANAGQGGVGQALSMGQALNTGYDLITAGVSKSVAAGFDKLITNGIGEKLGLSYYNGTAYEATGLGAQIGGYAGMAGSAMAGYGIGKSIGGGYQTGLGGTVDAIGAIASAFVGPLAGVASGLVNRAFGRKLADTGLEGTFGGQQGFTGNQFQFYKGGWFRSDKTTTTAMDAELQTGLAQSVKAVQTQAALWADAIGLSADAAVTYTESIKLSLNGLKPEEIQAKLQETLASYTNNVADAVLDGIAGNDAWGYLAKAGETATQTLSRLANNLVTVNSAFDLLGFALQEISASGAASAQAIVDAYGGKEAFTQLFGSFYDAYYTEEEKRANTIREITRTLVEAGAQVTEADVGAATKAQFREITESIIATQGATSPLAVALLKVSSAFASLFDSAGQAEGAMRGLQQRTKQLQVQLLEAQGDIAAALDLQRTIDTEGYSDAERAVYDYNRALQDQINAVNDAQRAAEEYAEAQKRAAEQQIEATRNAAQARLADAQSAIAAATSSIDAILGQATSAYVTAQNNVLAAQQNVASVLRQQAQDAYNAAKAIKDLGQSLRDFVNGEIGNAQQTFEVTLTRALAGDQEAMRSLPNVARSAAADAQRQAASAAEARLAEARIFADVLRVANIASSTTLPSVPEQVDPLVAANQELAKAQLQLSQALATANAIGAPLTIQVTDLIGQFTKAQAELAAANAEAAAAQAILQSIDENTGNTSLNTAQQVIATANLQSQILAALSVGFDSIDINTDGLLTISEFKLGLAGKASDAELTRIFNELDINGDGVLSRLEAIRISTATTADVSSISTGANLTVTFAADDPLRSIFENIGRTNELLIDAQQQTLQQLLGVAIGENLQALGSTNSQFEGTYKLTLDSRNYLQTIAHEVSKLARRSVGQDGGIYVKFARGGGPSQNVFAKGGAFTNGVVSRPTMFDMGLMGEAGPEAIMPLTRTAGGNLGVQVQMPATPNWGQYGRQADAALVAEIKALRAEVQGLRAEARATAINTGRSQDLLKRVTRNGEAMQTEATT